MKYYLIDTHVLIWYIEGINKISSEIIEIFQNKENKIIISSVSLWEITIKESLKKLNISLKTHEMKLLLERNNIEILYFDFDDLNILSTLPFYHRDPFDRMIISQAISNKLNLITYDEKIHLYNKELRILK